MNAKRIQKGIYVHEAKRISLMSEITMNRNNLGGMQGKAREENKTKAG